MPTDTLPGTVPTSPETVTVACTTQQPVTPLDHSRSSSGSDTSQSQPMHMAVDMPRTNSASEDDITVLPSEHTAPPEASAMDKPELLQHRLHAGLELPLDSVTPKDPTVPKTPPRVAWKASTHSSFSTWGGAASTPRLGEHEKESLRVIGGRLGSEDPSFGWDHGVVRPELTEFALTKTEYATICVRVLLVLVLTRIAHASLPGSTLHEAIQPAGSWFTLTGAIVIALLSAAAGVRTAFAKWNVIHPFAREACVHVQVLEHEYELLCCRQFPCFRSSLHVVPHKLPPHPMPGTGAFHW